MKFFYLSAHVSVAEDYSRILRGLGHEVDGHNLTGHNWVFGRKPEGPFGGFNYDHIWGYSENDGKKFYEEHKAKLKDYDAFITCYPPCFARLFARFEKPIINVLCVRYDFALTDNRERWTAYNGWFMNSAAAGQVIPVANNLYDVEYCKAFTGITPKYIPSLCDYTGVSYAPLVDTGLLSETRCPKLDTAMLKAVPNLRGIRHEYGKYRYDQIVRHRAIVHVPYNASVMTFFEHYAMGIPLFVPTPDFLIELKEKYGALHELVYNQQKADAGSFQPPSGIPDPNAHGDRDALLYWMRHYDHYTFPHVQKFDSFDALGAALTFDWKELSRKMAIDNVERRKGIVASWKELVGGIK